MCFIYVFFCFTELFDFAVKLRDFLLPMSETVEYRLRTGWYF